VLRFHHLKVCVALTDVTPLWTLCRRPRLYFNGSGYVNIGDRTILLPVPASLGRGGALVGMMDTLRGRRQGPVLLSVLLEGLQSLCISRGLLAYQRGGIVPRCTHMCLLCNDSFQMEHSL
jgi:hypothetical protein